MTDMTKAQIPQVATGDTVGRKPWKAPRLIDLDEDDSEGMNAGIIMGTINDKRHAPDERTRPISFLPDGIAHSGSS